MVPVISIVGYANSGKTTLLVKLIGELKCRGHRVAVVKHHHKNIEVDTPGKDTWRHAQAGADIVALAAPGKLAVFEQTEKELSIDEIVTRISGVDIIITEGFKKEKMPKIEVFRCEIHTELITPPQELLAIAGDIRVEGVPSFSLDDAGGLADFIVEKLCIGRC